jgi:nucleotide-binding universal stress UspA family protein
MTKVIAAIDSSAAAHRVLDRALALGRLLGLEVDALHILEDGTTTARACAEALDLVLHEQTGDPAEAVLEAGHEDDVAVLAFGVRDHELGPRPSGHVARSVLGSSPKPCLVIPPGTVRTGPLRRLVVALEADVGKARALDDVVRRLDEAGAELILLHVDDQASVPSFSDQVQHETEAYSHEFFRRYASVLGNGEERARLELRIGDPAQELITLAEEVEADLVVMSWRGALTSGRAPVVNELLTHVRIPVLLVPVVAATDPPGRSARHVAARP